MMLTDSWTVMNNSSSELDAKRTNKRKKCCGFLLWAVPLVAVVAVVTATLTLVYVKRYPLPFITRDQASSSSPVISIDPKESGATVTVSQAGDGILLDPECPDPARNFERWEALRNSLVRALSTRHAEDRQEARRARTLADEVEAAVGHARDLARQAQALKSGQGILEQRLEHLQNQQNRIAQVLSDEQAGVLKLSSALTDSLSSLQRETESLSRLHREKHTALTPRDCSEVMAAGNSRDGVYSVFPVHEPDGFTVFCDLSTDAGGWTVRARAHAHSEQSTDRPPKHNNNVLVVMRWFTSTRSQSSTRDPEETGRLCEFLSRLGRISRRLWNNNRRALARLTTRACSRVRVCVQACRGFPL
ncbi:fibrinogen C domain-containing protein 1-like isoform X3 [Phyllopteryx taeniolatus]|uniref:fibrinogen C domain-containing protein 1-like isoform X3 n=1 Tax=Phyllopteryx taeniolatus TaxID=161469 RepID=UPI002AD56829|nr:fibrinogen C domain-containing protein 1-like isoform X3 [Phyllopteryx taeniolatus]